MSDPALPHGCGVFPSGPHSEGVCPRRLPAEALHPVALQLEARSWLLSPAQRCPLVRAAFLQVLTLLPASLSPGFTQSIWDAVSAELGGLTLGREPGCAELQVLLLFPAVKLRAWEMGAHPCPVPRSRVLGEGLCFPPGGCSCPPPDHGPLCLQRGSPTG